MLVETTNSNSCGRLRLAAGAAKIKNPKNCPYSISSPLNISLHHVRRFNYYNGNKKGSIRIACTANKGLAGRRKRFNCQPGKYGCGIERTIRLAMDGILYC